MDRRRFLQSLAVTAACVESLTKAGSTTLLEAPAPGAPADIEGPTFICEFRLNQAVWKVYSGSPIRISQAPTRWGRVSLDLAAKPASRSVVATVELAKAGAPKEIHVKLRTPKPTPIRSATVNGRAASLGGPHHDTVIILTGTDKHFEVVGQFS